MLARCVVATSLSSCVLADPAPTLPLVNEMAPYIQAQTPEGPSLAVWPEAFVISVGLSDPTVTLFTEAFVDGAPVGSEDRFPPVGDGTASTRTLVIGNLGQPLGPGCPTIMIVVADSFQGTLPKAPGGAYAQWVYTGSGLEDCTSYDAGALADGSFPDAGAGDATAADVGP